MTSGTGSTGAGDVIAIEELAELAGAVGCRQRPARRRRADPGGQPGGERAAPTATCEEREACPFSCACPWVVVTYGYSESP